MPTLYTSGRQEVDLRKEFDEIVYGTGGKIPHGHKIIIRNLRRDAEGFPLKCVCNLPDTNEADPDCSYCFTGDTFVRTLTGYKCIKDISSGEFVLSQDGNYHEVVANLQRKSNGFISIKSRGRCDELKATTDHPFFVMRKEDINIHKYVISLAKAEDLHVGDLLLYPRQKNFIHKEYLDICLDNIISREDCKKKIPKQIPLNEDILWMFGIWCAEGHIGDERDIYFSFHIEEIEYTQRLMNIFNVYFPELNPRILLKPKSHVRQFVVANSALAKWFILNFNHGCANKSFPEWVMQLPPEKKISIVDGVFDGDGHHKKENGRPIRKIIGITSRYIIYQCQEILFQLGIGAQLRRAKKKENRKQSYTLEWTPLEERTNRMARGIYFFEDYIGTEIRSLSSFVSENEPVYDLVVPTGHSFVANNTLVHNCQGEGFYWDERWADCYSMYQNSEGGLIKKNINMVPGNLRVDFKVFYLRFNTTIKYQDKIIEVKLDNEGKIILPYKRIVFYKPETIQKYRSDYGRVEYIAVRCREDSALRFDDV